MRVRLAEPTVLVPRLLRALFLVCASGTVLFLALSGLAVYAGSPTRTVATFVLFAFFNGYGCMRARRWQHSLAAIRKAA